MSFRDALGLFFLMSIPASMVMMGIEILNWFN